jgi:hypothetical protein
MEELLEAMLSMWSVPRLHKEFIVHCDLVQQLEASWELKDEVGSWQLEVSPARKLAAEGSIGWSQRSEYEVGVRVSPPSDDISREGGEHPTLEAVTKQCDWEH